MEVMMEDRSVAETLEHKTGQVSPQGQFVVVVARWILVIAGFSLALWNPAPMGELRLQIATLLTLAVANFYLHAQLLRHKSVVDSVAYIAGGADLAVITAIIIAQGGYESSLYVFYCVALLAMSVAFPLLPTVLFAGITAGFYALIALATLPAGAHDTHLLAVLCRVLMLGAVAACGQVYRHLERTQLADARVPATPADRRHPLALEARRDVFFGQVVLIWARWAVIAAGAVMAMWLSDSSAALTLNILPVVVLMGINFYLHARYLLERPANQVLIKLLSAVDLAMVTAIVVGWDVDGAGRGLASPFYVYYYPLLLAFAFVFPPRLTAAFTAAVLAAYTTACLGLNPAMVADASELKLLVLRLITLGAMGGLGTYYWRIQRRSADGNLVDAGRADHAGRSVNSPALTGLAGAAGRTPAGAAA